MSQTSIEPKFAVKATLFKGSLVQRLFKTDAMANGKLAIFEDVLVFEPGGGGHLLGQGLLEIIRLGFNEIAEVGVSGPFKNWLKVTLQEDGSTLSFAIPRKELQPVVDYVSSQVKKAATRPSYCRNCGSAIDPASNFCGTCGAKIDVG